VNVAFHEPLVKEGLHQFRMQLQNFGHQVLQVDNLDAVVVQNLCECIVFLLRDLQVRNVVEQKFLQCVRRQIQQFIAGSVQQDFLQRLDLAFNANAFHFSLVPSRCSIGMDCVCAR